VLDLPPSERPREKLIAHGAERLSDAELIAILLATGQGAGKLSAVGLGNLLIDKLRQHQRQPLDMLREIDPRELMAIDGIGPAKAATIIAAIELGKRVFFGRPAELTTIDSPEKAFRALSQELIGQSQEKFAVLLLDAKNRLLGTQVITIGTATETLACPRDIFRESLKQGAIATIVAHNHPSGNTEPSDADLDLTRQLLQGGRILSVPILDHLIVGRGGDFCSLRQTTNLWDEVGKSTHSA
jgi:DNA repair protein RadC